VYYLNLEVGSFIIGLKFKKKQVFLRLKDYFDGYYSLKEPDMHIKIEITVRGRFFEVPNSLFLTKKVKHKRFVAGDGLIKGKYNKRKNQWTFIIHELLVEGDYIRVFEQILYQAYNSGSVNKQSFLVHSSGVIKEGNAYLFVGPSGSGKSTVAALSQKYQVINDEINIVNITSDPPTLEGTPFNGLYRDKQSGKAPLKGIFLLNQALFNGVEKISGAGAVKPLTKEIIPPIVLAEELSPETYIKMLDIARDISEHVPIYRMDFLPDDGFWNVLSKL